MQNYLSKTANDFTKHYEPSFLFFKSQIGLFIQGVFLTSPWLTWTIRRGYRSIALMRCQKKANSKWLPCNDVNGASFEQTTFDPTY
jgi:hypothetical protein